MDYLVVYDISSSVNRAKVAYILTYYGYHIGYSTFYLVGISKNKLEKIIEEIRPFIDDQVDRIFFYPVERIELLQGFPLEPWKIFVI